jgi:hypothetical protein
VRTARAARVKDASHPAAAKTTAPAVAAFAGRTAAQRRGRAASRARTGPARLARGAEPGDQPAKLRQDMAFRRGLLADALLERGPARLAVLPGDGQLGVVQGRKFTRGQAAFRLELQVPETRPGWQGTR